MNEKKLKKLMKEAFHEELISLVNSQEFGQIVLNIVNTALCREINVTKGARKQGDPEKVAVRETWNIVDWMVHYMPYCEGALRGMQEDVSKIGNKTDAVGRTLIGMERPLKTICGFSDQVRGLAGKKVIPIGDMNAHSNLAIPPVCGQEADESHSG